MWKTNHLHRWDVQSKICFHNIWSFGGLLQVQSCRKSFLTVPFAAVPEQAYHIPHSRSKLHLLITGCFHCTKEDRNSLGLQNGLSSTEVLKYSPSSTLTSSLELLVFHIGKPEVPDSNELCCSRTDNWLVYSGSSLILPRGKEWVPLTRRSLGGHPGKRDEEDMAKNEEQLDLQRGTTTTIYGPTIMSNHVIISEFRLVPWWNTIVSQEILVSEE